MDRVSVWNNLFPLGLQNSHLIDSVDLTPKQNVLDQGKPLTVEYSFRQGVIKLDSAPGAHEYILDFANKKFGGGVLGRGWVQEEQLVFCSSLMANNAQGVTNVQIFAENLQDNPAIIQCEAVLKIDSPTPGDPLHPYMAGRAGWTACENNLERAFHVVTPQQANLLAAAAPDLNVAVTRCKRPATKDDYAVWFKTCTKAFGLLPPGAVVHTGLWGAGYFGHSPVASLLLQLRAAGKMQYPPKLVFHIPTEQELNVLENVLKKHWPSLQTIQAAFFNEKLVKMTNNANSHFSGPGNTPRGQNCGYAEIYSGDRILMLWSCEHGKDKYTLPGGPYTGGFLNGFIPLLESQLQRDPPNFGNPPQFVRKNNCRHYRVELTKKFMSYGIKKKNDNGRVKYLENQGVKFKWVPKSDFTSNTQNKQSFQYGGVGEGEGEGEGEGGEIELDPNTLAYLGDGLCGDDGGEETCTPCGEEHGASIDENYKIPVDETVYEGEVVEGGPPQEGGAQERDGFLGLIAGLGVTTACAFLLSLTQ